MVPYVLRADIPELVRFCLTTTYFLCNKDDYERTDENAMGQPLSLSPAVDNILMKKFKEEVKILQTETKVLYKIHSDTLVIWSHRHKILNEFLNRFNIHHRI